MASNQSLIGLPPNRPSSPSLNGIPSDCRDIIFRYVFDDSRLIVRYDEYDMDTDESNESTNSEAHFKHGYYYHRAVVPEVCVGLLRVSRFIRSEALPFFFDNVQLVIDTQYTSEFILHGLPSHLIDNIQRVQIIGVNFEWKILDRFPSLQALELGGNPSYKLGEYYSILSMKVNTGPLAEGEEWFDKVISGAGGVFNGCDFLHGHHPLKDFVESGRLRRLEVVINFHIVATDKVPFELLEYDEDKAHAARNEGHQRELFNVGIDVSYLRYFRLVGGPWESDDPKLDLMMDYMFEDYY